MNILMAASEMAPFVQTGALADSVADLTTELKALGHEVSVVLPYYRAIREGKLVKTKKTNVRFTISVGPARYPCEILECKAPSGVRVFLVARDEYFDRSGLYGIDGRDYQDNSARFIFFTKCVLELARRMDPLPSVLHSHSWPTALAPVFVRDQQLPFKTVLTPHSLEYQGNFWSYDFGLTNLPGDYFSARGVEYYGSLNCLKGGILYADSVVLPGERFVAAAQTPDYGCGLETVLREQSHKLCGIPSADGVQDWNPAADKNLASPFSAASPAGRSGNQAAFFEATGLASGQPRASFVCFSEASNQLGVDTLLGSLDRLLVEDVRVALFGPVPEASYVQLEVARRKHAGRFAYLPTFDDALARKALAGADFLVVPGAVEPRAAWLRRGLLYGAIPIVAQCGGLYQVVRDWDPGAGQGNGFISFNASVDSLLDSCRRALRLNHDAAIRETLRARCLDHDYSSRAVAAEHVALYERLVDPSRLSRAA